GGARPARRARRLRGHHALRLPAGRAPRHLRRRRAARRAARVPAAHAWHDRAPGAQHRAGAGRPHWGSGRTRAGRLRPVPRRHPARLRRARAGHHRRDRDGARVTTRHRPAEVADVHALATAMPHVTCVQGPSGNPVYQVGGKSFVFFRTPRPDATDPRTGERYADVIMFWVASETEKLALVDDPGPPFFTTAHFDGHLSVLVRAARPAGGGCEAV